MPIFDKVFSIGNIQNILTNMPHSLSELCNDQIFVGPKSRQPEQEKSLKDFIIILRGMACRHRQRRWGVP